MAELRLSQLPPTWQRMVETLSALEFGSIEALIVRAGEPVLDPPPIVNREFKFSEASSSSVRTDYPPDYLLRKQIVQLIETLEALGNATIDRLEVRHGLPHRIVVRDRQLLGRQK